MLYNVTSCSAALENICVVLTFACCCRCWFCAAENEVNVRHLLDTFPCLKLIPAEPRLGGCGLTGPADLATAQALVKAAVAAAAQPAGSTAEAGAGTLTAQVPSLQVNDGGSDAQPAEVTVQRPSCRRSPLAQLSIPEHWLSNEEAAMVQRFDPGGPADTIGFFVAKFKKVSSLAT